MTEVGAIVAREVDLQSARWWVDFGFLQLGVVVGYAASSLPLWAKWYDGAAHDRLTILRGLIASILAGNIAYGIGFYYANLPQALCYIVAPLAAYAGDTFLLRALDRMTGKLDGPVP